MVQAKQALVDLNIGNNFFHYSNLKQFDQYKTYSVFI